MKHIKKELIGGFLIGLGLITQHTVYAHLDPQGNWQGKTYLKADGNLATEEWIFDPEYQSWFYFKEDGTYAENEWIQQGQTYYYFKSGGYMAKSEWVTVGDKDYYLSADGKMLSQTWIGSYYVNASGARVKQGWVFDEHYDSWFYFKEDGTYAENGWLTIQGNSYYFKTGGYLATSSWIDRYYVTATGKMAKQEWLFDAKYNSWFYFKEDGTYAENGWLSIQGEDYYFKTGGYLATSSWIDHSYVKSDGKKAKQGWLFDPQYNTWFFIKKNGNYAENEWIQDNGYYYFKSGGYMAENEWIYDNQYQSWFFIKSNGKAAEEELLYDHTNQAWYYFKKGGYMAINETVDGYTLDSDGNWEVATETDYYKVLPTTAMIYDAYGQRLSYVTKDSIVALDHARSNQEDRLAIAVSGLAGYMNKKDLIAVNKDNDFIPYFESDGKYFYHEIAPQASIRLAPHISDMEVGKKYYSTDGIHFEGFTVTNPFLFANLTQATNYSAEELDQIYQLMNISDSLLAGKGATFKEAEEHYHVNALYLIAHSALESSWGRSQIAKDKNNFFGIAAYDSTPYLSAKTFDDVDKGILGAAKWIHENYLSSGNEPYLGNKASGMNVNYASDPYWGEKIASIMMMINDKLGDKD